VRTPDGIERERADLRARARARKRAPQDLLDLACTLAQDLPLMPADISKAERGYRLFLDTPLTAAARRASTLERRPERGRGLPHPGAVLRAPVAGQCRCRARTGDADDIHPDFIHQLRVAQRRLRALLKLFAPALPENFAGTWNARLRDNANRFGDARDLDVFHAELLEPVTPRASPTRPRWRRCSRPCAGARNAARHFAGHKPRHRHPGPAAARVHRRPAPPAVADSLAEAADLRSFARLRLDRLRKRARRGAAAASLEPTRLHALRIDFKLLRYGVEFFAPLFAARAINRYLDGVVRAQTALGFLQDVDIAHQRLSDWSRSSLRSHLRRPSCSAGTRRATPACAAACCANASRCCGAGKPW
jgi:CHAD domain-containing protein